MDIEEENGKHVIEIKGKEINIRQTQTRSSKRDE